MITALLVIDVQNDYFPGGAFPLWNPEATLEATVAAIGRARSRGEPVSSSATRPPRPTARYSGRAPGGAEIHSRIIAAAGDAPVVVKRHADSFHRADLARVLTELGATNLRIAGMMTQNCVAFTAVSRDAAPYEVSVLCNCVTTVDGHIQQFALHALSTRVAVVVDA